MFVWLGIKGVGGWGSRVGQNLTLFFCINLGHHIKDAYYMMDDVLDTWNTTRIKSQIQKEGEKPADSKALTLKKKVCSFFPSPSCCFRQVDNLSLCHDIGYKIKELNETLDKILKDRMTYGFDLTRQFVQMERPKTTSFVDVSNITGRDEDRDNLVNNLVMTYVVYLLGTYVTILCNWLIL